MNRFIPSSCIGLLVVGTASAQIPADTAGEGGFSLPVVQVVRPAATVERFVELDANGDGLLTPDEIQGARSRPDGRNRQQFADSDTDGDGAISLPELQAASTARAEEQFNRMDVNDDDLITMDEGRELRRRGNRRDDVAGGRRRGRDSDNTT
jgi:hypothetical protein